MSKMDFPPTREEKRKVHSIEDIQKIGMQIEKEGKDPELSSDDYLFIVQKFAHAFCSTKDKTQQHSQLTFSLFSSFIHNTLTPNKKGTRILDGVFEALVKIKNNNPQGAAILLQYIGADLEYVDPDILIDSFSQMEKTRDRYDDSFNSRIISTSVYNIKYKDWFLQRILKRLDVTTTSDIDRSSRTLDYLWRVFAMSHYESYAHDKNLKQIQRELTRISEDPRSNYFLKVYVDRILEISHTSISLQALNSMDEAKEYAKGTFAFSADSVDWESFTHDIDKKNIPTGMLISSPQEYEKIKTYFNEDEDNASDFLYILHNFHSLSEKDIVIDRNKKITSKDLQDFALIFSPFFYTYLNNDIQLDLKNLSIQEQFQLLHYIKTHSVSDMERVKTFNARYSTIGFRTFLSLEQGGRAMGDTILALGENLPPESAKKLFEKYSEIVDVVSNLTEGSLKNITEKDSLNSVAMLHELKEKMILKGKELLSSYEEKLTNGALSIEKMHKDLSELKADTEMFRTFFRLAREEDDQVTITDFKALEIARERQTNELYEEAIVEMEAIIERNYKDTPELRQFVLDSLRKNIREGGGHTTVNLLKRDGKIIAFDRLDERDDGSLYFGSFNVDPSYCSSKIGDAFFQASIAPHM